MKPGDVLWEEEAVEYLLEELLGYHTRQEIAKRFNRAAKRNGWTQRTQKAIESKVFKLTGTWHHPTQFDNYSQNQLSQILKLSRNSIARWRQKGLEGVRQGNRVTITRTAFAQFVSQNPHLMASCDREGLKFLLDGKRSVLKKVDGIPRRINYCKRPVRCVNTGEVFDSLQEAADAKFMSPDRIRASVVQGVPIYGGVQWVDAS